MQNSACSPCCIYPPPLPSLHISYQGRTVGVALFWMVPREHLELKKKSVLALVSSYNLEPRWRGTVCPQMPQDVSPLPGELLPDSKGCAATREMRRVQAPHAPGKVCSGVTPWVSKAYASILWPPVPLAISSSRLEEPSLSKNQGSGMALHMVL